MQAVTHEDYLAAIATAVCEQSPATAAALSEVQLAFGTGLRRRTVGVLHRVWSVGTAHDPLPLVEIAAIGGLAPAETCHVVLHELAHVLARAMRRFSTHGWLRGALPGGQRHQTCPAPPRRGAAA